MSISSRTLLKWSPAIVFVLALTVFLGLFFRFQRRPVVTGLDRLTAGAGDRIEITGRWFGDGEDGAKLFVGTNALTSTGIIEWEDTRILARVPRSDGAVLVKVKTRSGTSRGAILGDSDRFPEVDYGAWLPGAPYIEYAEPTLGVPGDLVTFHGRGFGNRKESGRIWLSTSGESFMMGIEEPDLSAYVEVVDIESWTDNRVSFRIPEGAGGGNAYLSKSGYFSNPVTVELGTVPGVAWEGDPVFWSLRQEVGIERVGAFPGNSLYLRLPAPMAGAGQREAVILAGPDGASSTLVRRDGSLDLYRIDELLPGADILVSRQLVVPVSPVRFQVDPAALNQSDPAHPSLAEALGTDQWIQPQSVSQTAARIAGRLGNDWSISRAVYDYVIAVLQWSESPSGQGIVDYLQNGEADVRGYSFLTTSLLRSAGVPARPVGGMIVDSDGNGRTWWWCEVWLQGLGWVPLDPALGDGAGGISLPGGPEEAAAADYYFGGLEGRHIAFSRGILDAPPLQPEPVLSMPDEPYSLQDTWEESSGNLESYVSHWPVPRITASYDP